MSHNNNIPPTRNFRYYQSTASLCESDAEALSQECALDNASQFSLSSNEEEDNDDDHEMIMHDHDDMPPPPNVVVDSIPVIPVVDPIPSDVQKFAELASRHPQLNADIRKFRTKWKKHHDTHLLSNPSLAVANDKADKLRLEFTSLVNLVATREIQSSWSSLNEDQCDKFLAHLFLPPELGGFLEAYEE